MSEDTYNEEARDLYQRLDRDAEASGYNLNPDMSMTMPLVAGLLENASRYGYPLCPCRLTGGGRKADIDVICPCDYRDADLDEYDACY
jgi:ferredoxin-thioredoxin reductase catalytic subunit